MDIFAIQCNISILRRFKGKLYSCEEFNIVNRLARKIKRRLNFIPQLFVSALKTRYTVHFYGGTERTVGGRGDTCPIVTVVPLPVRAYILWMYTRVFTHYNVKQKLNILCVYVVYSYLLSSIYCQVAFNILLHYTHTCNIIKLS